jgi:hypothetical protein
MLWPVEFGGTLFDEDSREGEKTDRQQDRQGRSSKLDLSIINRMSCLPYCYSKLLKQ